MLVLSSCMNLNHHQSVALAANMIGRVPLMHLFLARNLTPSIPHQYSKEEGSGIPIDCHSDCVDTAAIDGRHCSKIYIVSPWFWQSAVASLAYVIDS
jgi:hypothetical protein